MVHGQLTASGFLGRTTISATTLIERADLLVPRMCHLLLDSSGAIGLSNRTSGLKLSYTYLQRLPLLVQL